MIDILADSTTGYIVGGAGVSGATIVGLIIRRSVNKVLSHPDDTKIHVNPDNGYMRQSVCKERSDGIKGKIAEVKSDVNDVRGDIKGVHHRMDKLIDAIINEHKPPKIQT